MCKNNERDEINKLFDVFSELKNKNVKFKNKLIEKIENKNENHAFEQEYYSTRAKGIYKIRHDSMRIMSEMAYYD